MALSARIRPSAASRQASRTSTVSKPRTVLAPVRAQAQQDGVLGLASSWGLPTEEGLFGFKPFAEQWCGRLAMMGFATSIVEEFLTGQGTLAQIHVTQGSGPDFLVLALLCTVFGGATLYGAADTVNKLRNKQLSQKEMDRYKKFLGLKNEKATIRQAAAAMKQQPGFTDPGLDMQAVEASKAAGTPVDAFLSTNEVAEGEAAAKAMKTGTASQQPAMMADALMMTPAAELAYAQQVEITNGRWAMLGFLAAVLVEAGTGNGIIGQLIMFFKLTGFLGANSGF